MPIEERICSNCGNENNDKVVEICEECTSSNDLWKPKKKIATSKDYKDMVHKVSHYNTGNVETIDILEQACNGLNGFEGGYIFTILRYLLRWKYKGGIEDLKKAHNYLGRLINILENGKHEWKE